MALPQLTAAARRSAVAALVAVAFPAALAAQARPVTVIGFVTDSTAAPVPAVEVLVDGTTLHTRTDDQGGFRFAGLRPGPLTLTVRRLGFRARHEQYATHAGDTLQLVLDLAAIPVELSGVTVTGQKVQPRSTWLDEFELRREQGFGQFVTRAQIEKRNPGQTSDLFRSMAGVAVLRGKWGTELRMARSRSCAPDIYIDGLEARGMRIDDIPVVDIAGIEVFSGPAETPLRFRRYVAGCGVISIWTRPPGSE